MELNNQISAVVTGGASGLGAATVRMLAAHGVRSEEHTSELQSDRKSVV